MHIGSTDLRGKKIYVAGSGGMVGNAVVHQLRRCGYDNILTATSSKLNLIDQASVERFFSSQRPEIVILAAAKVGGILANNTLRAEFIYNNLMIESNVIHAAFRHNAKKLIFMGSSCIYPKLAPQPISEEYLLTGPLESTNEPYAIAKIAGIKLCESYFHQYGSDFFSVMPTNLYGVNDNFELTSSHVIPALIRKFHDAKVNNSDHVVVWGTGSPRREFLYIDDLANAVVFLLENTNAASIYGENVSHLNIGSGMDLSIAELAHMVMNTVGFSGNIRFDTEKPDGTPRKLLDVARLNKLGWKYKIELEEGLRRTYDWFLTSGQDSISKRNGN